MTQYMSTEWVVETLRLEVYFVIYRLGVCILDKMLASVEDGDAAEC